MPPALPAARREATLRLWRLLAPLRSSELDLLEIERALADGAVLDPPIEPGESLLCRAVGRSGDPRAVQLLLDAGARLFDDHGHCAALERSERLIFDEGGRMALYVQHRVQACLALAEREELEREAVRARAAPAPGLEKKAPKGL